MKAPEKDVLRIGGGNVYVGNKTPEKAVRAAQRLRTHSWGWSEGKNLPKHLRAVKNYDPLISFGSADPADANDCVMQVRKTLDVEHFSMTKVCDDVPDSKVGHRRTFSMIAYAAPFLGEDVTVCHIAIHPNWIVGIDGTASKVVQEYIESLVGLRAMLAFAKAMGWHIVVTGDFNTRRPGKNNRKSFETVYDVFADFNLAVKVQGIDGIAYDRRLALVNFEVIDPRRYGSDHPVWTVADFRRKAARRKAA